MTTISWILLTVSVLMYLEGLIIASFAGAMSQTPKAVWPLLLIFWPVALPVLAYKTYVKYRPMIQQIQENPLLGALLGIRPATPVENPLQSLFATASSPNPYLTDVFTDATPQGESETETTETTETTKPAEKSVEESKGDQV